MLLCQSSVLPKRPDDRDRMVLKAPVRIVPLWRDLKVQLMETLELQKGMPEPTEGSPILLSDRPNIIFRESCEPDSMPLVFFIRSSDVESYLASFTWKRGKGSKVRAWIYSSEDETTVTEREYSIIKNPRVLMIVHVSHLHLLVAFCDDIHLRFFGDYTQGYQLLSEMSSPYSITSLCSNSETGELVTGAIGIVTFWSFVIEDVPSINIEQEVLIASGEFVHFLRVEPEWGALVALCENNIRVYNYKTKVQICNFQVSQGVSLTCCTSNCAQGFLYTGDLAGDITVWDFLKGNLVHQFKAHLSAITSIISRMSVHTLMTASLDGLLKEWNLTTCEQLRRVDIGEEVFQMQFINEQTFFLRTRYTFSIRTVNNFYQLFNRSKSSLKKLERVQCGSDKARILAATEDGVVRFLSPVTGEMLFVTWPFQLLEKALDYVYDPDQEELLITLGTSDIYVMDTAKNPCPVKYILHTADSIDDKVLCLAYSRLDLNGRTSSFIFSGFKSGKVRTVTQNLYRMGGRRIHNGNVLALSSLSASGNLSYHSRESSYLCSYGLDNYIILSDVILKKSNLLEVVPLVSIQSTNCRINNLLLIPGYICVLTDQNRVRLWRQATLVPGKKNPFWKETGAMHSSSITSFDYCHTLSLLVTGGSDGSVRIWDILGQMLVEFDTTLKFSRVCFANQRGDLIVGFNMNIYFIPCVSYLPNKHLMMLATRSVRDDTAECPLPFMTRFLLSFDIVFVPKYHQVGKKAKKFERLEPITNHKEVVMEKGVAKVMSFIGKRVSSLPGPDFYGLTPDIKELHPEFAVEYQLLSRPTLGKRHAPAEPPLAPPPYRGLPPLSKIVPLHRSIPFQPGRTWPIAPDGFVPNSVIRAQLFPHGIPTSLECPLIPSRDPLPMRKLVKIQLQDWDKSEVVEKARKKKAEKLKRPTIEGRRRDLLSEIVTKPWLRHKPSDTSLPSVIKAIINIMDDVPYSTYLLCTSALVQLSESYELPTPVQEQAFDRLIQDTNHKEVRMRLAAWEALGKMDLLTDQEVVPLARALLDENKKVRDLARSLLDSVAGITDKFVLKKEMQRMAGTSLDDLAEMNRSQIELAFPRRMRAAGIIAETQDEAVQALTEESERLLSRVENQLTANLFLMTETPTLEAQRFSRPPRFRQRALSQGAQEEIAKPDSHLEARARWLGLFARTDKLKSQAAATKQLKGEKLRKIRQAHGKYPGVFPGMAAPDGSPVSSSSSPSSSLSSSVGSGSVHSSAGSGVSSASGSIRIRVSSSTWQGPQRPKKKVKVTEKAEEIKLAPALSQVTRKLPKVHKRLQPILLQRRDTRTQLYTEMLKHQKVKKEPAVVTAPMESKQEIAPVPLKPSPSVAPPPPPPPPPAPAKGTLIDPNEQYNTDRTKWRKDLYKLMTLRIGSFAEGRTAAEDFLASARAALSGRPMSWEAFTNISQAFLSSQEKITSQASSWKKYMSELFRASSQEFKPSTESLETVLDVKKGRDIFRGSLSDAESLELSQEDSDLERRKEERRRRTKEKKELDTAAAVKKEMSMASKMQATRKKMEREEKMARRLAKEGKLAKLKDQDTLSLDREREVLAKEKEYESAEEKEYVLVRGTGKGKEQEAAKRKEQEAVKGKRHEAAKGKEYEAAKGKEHEAAKGKEHEAARREEREAAMEEEREAARVKEREAAKAKEREAAARRRRERVSVSFERKEKEAAKKKLEKLADEKREAFLEEKEKFLKEVDAKIESMLKSIKKKHGDETLLTDSERTLFTVTESTIAEFRAEAKERMLAELKERALVEAQKIALEEVKERALAEARELALEEARNWALLQARKMSLIEAWEKVLTEAREKAVEEVKEQALAEARERVLAEARERALAEEEEEEMEAILEEKIQALAEVRAKELAEERAVEMALLVSLEADEDRVLQLLGAFPVEADEARIFELAVERARELTEARAMELVEEKMTQLSDSVIMELVEEKILELIEAQMKELEKEEEKMAARQRLIPGSKEYLLARKKLFSAKEEDGKEEEEEEAGMWEDLEEGESPWSLTERETETLIAMAQKEPVPSPKLEFSERAQLILDVLTGPEKLERTDSEDFQRLCQVVSLLDITSTTDIQALTATLLQKVGETIKEGEEQQALLPEEDVSVLRVLKDTFRARQSWMFDPAQFSKKLSGLLKAAETVMQAKKLKEKLDREFWKKCWEDRAMKPLEAGEMKIRGKKAWLGKKLKDALRKWRVDQERAHWEKREKERLEKRLKIRSRPILLDVSEKEKDEESVSEEEKAAEDEEKQKEERTTRRKHAQLTWSLTAQRERAWKVIVQMEKQLPLSTEEKLRRHRPKGHRLPKESLYLASKPVLTVHRKTLRRGAQQHIFRLDHEKGVDWDSFMNIYQSLMALKQEEGGMDTAAWHEQSAQLLDLYGTSNLLVRNMLQQLLLGDRRDRKYVMGSTLKMRKAEADLGQRILYELIHHSARLRPRPPTIHGIIPLSYQNNVHPFKMRGTTRYGTLAFKWKTYMSKGKMPRLRLFVHSNSF
ncbi:WD repeat-containing protein 87-like [Anolis sagrei]|uniref:WD repeat-containing protein 87-like n=1 Tax=Anolis sagrei TaxID=38937 RepID=UPI0035208E7A